LAASSHGDLPCLRPAAPLSSRALTPFTCIALSPGYTLRRVRAVHGGRVRVESIVSGPLAEVHWHTQASGIHIADEAAAILEDLWARHLHVPAGFRAQDDGQTHGWHESRARTACEPMNRTYVSTSRIGLLQGTS
jgi:hypothetical protein